MLDKIVDKVKKEAGNVRDALEGDSTALAKADESPPVPRDIDHGVFKKSLKDMALEKVVDKIDEFNEALPAFEEAGFTLKRLDIEIGISPAVVARFDIRKIANEKERKSALLKLQGETSLQSLLNSMLGACRLHHVMRIGDLELIGIAVTLSTLPSVKLIFGEEVIAPDEEM